MPERVSVYEVSLRDGLQNERAQVPLQDKLRLVDALIQAKIDRIELTSFVSPKWIPQLADADDLVARAPSGESVRYSALCPNERGLDRALAAGLSEVAVFLSASETHNQKNVNKSTAETLDVFRRIVPRAREAGLRVRGYVSTVWGCPFEGEVAVERVRALTHELLAIGCYQVSLGDTIGSGTPCQSERILDAVMPGTGQDDLAMHMHDTRGTALANIVVGLQLGIRHVDGSVGGLGGCPYAPGAAGNVATEDLVYMLHGMGIETGIDLDALVVAARVAESIVGHPLAGRVQKAGVTSLKA